MLEPNQIHHGDCLELMWDIPDKSIDMILADLPYGTTACAWDSIIPLDLLWAHYKRIIKPRGAIVLTASQPFTTILINAGGLDWFKYSMVWDKMQGKQPIVAHLRPMKSHEDICIFYNEQPTYNPQKHSGKAYTDKRSVGNFSIHRGQTKARSVDYSGRMPLSICSYPMHNRPDQHPTQKPVALFAYLIRTYTNPGDLVLDNTAGSGTTAIAAIDTGRNWLCIEQDPEYFRLAKERIAQRLQQPFLPGISGRTSNKHLQRSAQARLFAEPSSAAEANGKSK